MIDKFEGEFAFLSNFFESPFQVGSVTFPTVEHYFQAMKADSMHDYLAIAAADTPGKAKRLGRKCTLRWDWEEVKMDVMRTGLRHKFADPELRKKLIATYPHRLEEGNWWGDRFWGVCQGQGENNLGKLLMELREELMEEVEE